MSYFDVGAQYFSKNKLTYLQLYKSGESSTTKAYSLPT